MKAKEMSKCFILCLVIFGMALSVCVPAIADPDTDEDPPVVPPPQPGGGGTPDEPPMTLWNFWIMLSAVL
ncbi:hypothetical protein JW979_02440 [bacterium]|nr:hypothetical protein [candidate division CSSED10-310 bacterium]